MIRLAWHCSGSYRESDGRGGCDGGRIRFDPELNWDDNANLNNALKILEPIKEKFGSKLSWGDLVVLAGNTAIEEMGGPIFGFCGGRIDDPDGANSLILGPSDIQEQISPCVSIGEQGRCMSPLGPTTVGLIYVNPAGPVGNESMPKASGADIRQAFTRMGFNDRESVALIGGGHAFGKCHGACASPPCGTGDLEGIGNNTFTSGFEGAWTTRPATWTNEYFNNLFDFNWTVGTGPGGSPQWAPDGEGSPDIMMLTTDIALSEDETYKPISKEYAADLSSLENDFKKAWYRLTTGDMGPPARCLGDETPEAQPWQNVLPAPPTDLLDYVPIRSEIQSLIDSKNTNLPAFAKLAWNCASTFRETDYRGGCNGARIRFEPESDWESNAGASDAISTLKPVKVKYPDVSYADLIVLAGQTAIEAAGGKPMKFCAGRTDASNGDGSDILAPRIYPDTVISIEDDMHVKGLTLRQGTALFAVPTGATLSNKYFEDLVADNGSFTDEEKALLQEPFKPIVDEYIADNDVFLMEFEAAWTTMMTADRFDGPTRNSCTGVDHATLDGGGTSAAAGSSLFVALLGLVFLALF